MSVAHLVRVGLMGAVGKFVAADSCVYVRDSDVICRTQRGFERGQVICELPEAESFDPDSDSTDGSILRPTTPEDQLILDRLERHRDKAFVACQQLLTRSRGFKNVLVDVEHLYSMASRCFSTSWVILIPTLEELTEQLAATYDRKVRFKKFAESLAEGCGPDCGTKEGSCSSSGCGSCKLSGSCGK